MAAGRHRLGRYREADQALSRPDYRMVRHAMAFVIASTLASAGAVLHERTEPQVTAAPLPTPDRQRADIEAGLRRGAVQAIILQQLQVRTEDGSCVQNPLLLGGSRYRLAKVTGGRHGAPHVSFVSDAFGTDEPGWQTLRPHTAEVTLTRKDNGEAEYSGYPVSFSTDTSGNTPVTKADIFGGAAQTFQAGRAGACLPNATTVGTAVS